MQTRRSGHFIGRRLAYKIAGAMTIHAAAMPLHRANAYVRPSSGACVFAGSSLSYFLSDAGAVTWGADPSRIQRFVAGATSWSSLKRLNGASALVATRLMTEPSAYASNQYRFILSNTAANNTTNCAVTPRTITIRSQEAGNDVQYASAHEIGHAFGLRHSGIDDNITDAGTLYGLKGFQPGPLMSGCIRPGGSGYQNPRVDDWASVWHKTSGNQSTAADGGNESSGLSLWQRGGTVINDSAVKASGQRSFRIDNSGYIAQRSRIASPAASLTFGLKYKHNSASSTFKGEARVVGYNTLASCYLDSPAHPTGSNWITLVNQGLSAQSTWTTLSVVSSSTNWSIYAGLDTHVFVHNSANQSSVWADDVVIGN